MGLIEQFFKHYFLPLRPCRFSLDSVDSPLVSPLGLPPEPPLGPPAGAEGGEVEIVGATNNTPVAAMTTLRVFTFTLEPTGTYVPNLLSKTLTLFSNSLRTDSDAP